MSANPCSSVDSPELLSTLSSSPGALAFAGFSFALTNPAAVGLEAGEVPLICLTAAPAL
jgi:hypothetical protein